MSDEFRIPERFEREMLAGMRAHDRQQRRRALKALWLPPVPTTRKKDPYADFRDNRGDDWTFWRAVRATIGLVLARYQTDAADERQRERCRRKGRLVWVESWDMAYWDAGSTYGGYTVDVLKLHHRCRIAVFNDGECFM